jgi:hypothetical protein
VDSHRADVEGQKSFDPDSRLIQYMQERLQLSVEMEKLDAAGEEFSSEINTKDRGLRTKKTRVLDQIVFPAMANLIYFFKSIAVHPELQTIFENDIKDLLGIRRDDPQKHDSGFLFYDLLDYIIIGSKEGRYSDKRDDRVDFRLILNDQAQKIVAYKMKQSSVSILKMGGPRAVINRHFDNVWAWTEMLSQIAMHKVNDKSRPNRTFEIRDHYTPVKKQKWTSAPLRSKFSKSKKVI